MFNLDIFLRDDSVFVNRFFVQGGILVVNAKLIMVVLQ